ncbi:hypothetical protein [Risungbinella massiliensis]|nr:hypothetical protein [Risungbinella massiliensis]
MGVTTTAGALIVASSVYFGSIRATQLVIKGVTYAVKKRPKIVVIYIS